MSGSYNTAFRASFMMPRMSNVKPIPAGFHSLTPAITVEGAAEAIAFYRRAFGAEEIRRFAGGGKIFHAEIRIGDSIVMLTDAMPEWGFKSPKQVGGISSSLMFYCADADAVFNRAVEAGATVASPMDDVFSGQRYGAVICPWGHRWAIATQREDLSDAEVQKRMDDWMASIPKK